MWSLFSVPYYIDYNCLAAVYKESILHTDYTTYALTIGCKHVFDDKTKEFGRVAAAKIWSRNDTLNQDVIDTLASVASSYDIDPNEFRKQDRSHCN